MHYTITKGTADHVPLLQKIERAASELFSVKDLPAEIRSHVTSWNTFNQAISSDRLWIIAAEAMQPVGFALISILDDQAHLCEMDVHPDHGRQGLGTRLMRHVLNRVQARGFAYMTLTTFEHLGWNAPFYAKLGFKKLEEEEMGSELRENLELERRFGLKRRIAMRMELKDLKDPSAG